MAKYNTGDYFLDYAKNLCVIEDIFVIEEKYTFLCILNVQNKTTYPFRLNNEIHKEKHIFKWFGEINNKTAQLLYIR